MLKNFTGKIYRRRKDEIPRLKIKKAAIRARAALEGAGSLPDAQEAKTLEALLDNPVSTGRENLRQNPGERTKAQRKKERSIL